MAVVSESMAKPRGKSQGQTDSPPPPDDNPNLPDEPWRNFKTHVYRDDISNELKQPPEDNDKPYQQGLPWNE